MALTALAIKNAEPRDKNWKLSDEKGLYLLITPAGSKLWQFKFRHLGKEKKMSFGAYPEVSLKDARAKRDEARALLANGRDPAHERRAERLAAKVAAANTFGAIAQEFIERRQHDGLADATIGKAKWLLSLLEPSLGRVPITEISPLMLLNAIAEVQATGRRETGQRLRSFAGRVFRYAVITGRALHNPAGELRGALVTPRVRHHPAIIDRKLLGELLRAIENYRGAPSTIAALKLSAHLFQRPGEIRTMRWLDVDLDRACWTIPDASTKMRREHKVPLSRQALEIIRSMMAISGRSEFVLPSYNARRPLSENAVNGALRRMGFGGVMTAHGFRSTASSLLNESGKWQTDAIERALAHVETNPVKAAYNRTTYWAERVAMHQWWSDELEAIRDAAT
jgi:Integrase